MSLYMCCSVLDDGLIFQQLWGIGVDRKRVLGPFDGHENYFSPKYSKHWYLA